MKRHIFLTGATVLIMLTIISAQALSQFQSKGVRIGISGGIVNGLTSFVDDYAGASHIFLRHNIVDYLDGDLSGTYGGIEAKYRYQSDLYYGEYKLLYKPCTHGNWEPYVGAGLGLVNYHTNWKMRKPWKKTNDYVGYLPVTAGAEYALGDRWQIDVHTVLNYAFSNEVVSSRVQNGNGENDAWWGVFAGISYTVFPGNNDLDGDGLTNSEEQQIGTDPKNPDTDGDRMGDGNEVNKCHTNPLKADSDGDGLSDTDELMVYKTDPNKVDTDGDSLSDGDEFLKYKTDPLLKDTDGDGLTDGDEVLNYKTDPLTKDTDRDGLSDYDELMAYKTDPKKADTDGDGISDGDEIKNATNPLDPNDPKKPEPKKEAVIPTPEPPKLVIVKPEVNKAIVLEGVQFGTGSAVIAPESEQILSAAKKTLEDNPELCVEIRGYTDNVGSAKKNLQLSQKRAQAVKTWLVNNGIDGSRVSAKGYGVKNPIGDNATPEGRQMNRRIEFFRTK